MRAHFRTPQLSTNEHDCYIFQQLSSLEQVVQLLFVLKFFCRGLTVPASFRACQPFSSNFRRHVNNQRHLYAITVAISNHNLLSDPTQLLQAGKKHVIPMWERKKKGLKVHNGTSQLASTRLPIRLMDRVLLYPSL